MKKLLSLLAVSALFSAGLPAEAVDSLNEFRVVVIDAKSATVTARDNKTGNTFKFKVNDQRMLQAIKVGDAGQADFKTGKVTVQPRAKNPIAGVILRGDSLQPGRPFGPDLVPYIGVGSTQNCSTPCAQCPPITVEIGVKNRGAPTSTGDPIMIKLEGAHSYTKAVNNIMLNGLVLVGRFSHAWPCPPKGTQSSPQIHPPNHRITVDTTNAVAESFENNNGRDFYMPPDATFTPQ
jgi:hypothetical protein